MTVREFISQVRNDLNSINIDDWIPGKYIHEKGKNIAALFIKREADNKALFKYPELWVTIPCVPLEEVPLIDCCNLDIPNCKTVMRSKEKLPKLFNARSGSLITLYPLDYNTTYIQTDPREYNYITKREYKNPKNRYFWIENEYLILPDSMVESIKVYGMFQDKAAALRLSGECGCEDDSDKCIRTLDQEFVAPEHLRDDIVTNTVQKIAGVRKQIQPDTYPNNNANERSNPQTL